MKPAIITSLKVDNPDLITISLDDGRSLIVPVHFFPEIAALSQEERRRWILLDEQVFSFEDADEVFHLQQMLGFASTAAIPSLKYA